MPERTKYTHGTPSWTDLTTTDPEAAQDFYGALFDWDFNSEPTNQGGTYITASKNKKSAAGIMQQPEAQAEQGMPSMWTSYVSVDDLDKTTGQVEGAGGQVLMPSMMVMEAGKMAVVGDPSGAAIALWEANNSIGAEVVNEHGALIWNELMSADLGAASEFYDQLFGWSPTEEETEVGPYTMFSLEEKVIAGAMAPPMPGIPNHWAVYFGIDDAESAVKTITEKGGTVLNGPMEIGVGTIVAAQDPQGATLHLMQPAPEE